MCTVILLRRPGHAWPALIAANRDERLDRAWDPPAAWWPDRPGVIGGRDRSAGGTWMAANPAGLVAAVLNRPGSLGPAPGKRSRGELPLLALEHGSAAAAAAAIAALPAEEWRPFNMLLADRREGFFLRGTGTGRPEVEPLPAGVSMITAHDPNDLSSPRT
ncbi:MAG: NRDE family protein, partial [Acetobacteraceae bacterium]|nr:NRDE family protein [Acetobacteraceae bacterium]